MLKIAPAFLFPVTIFRFPNVSEVENLTDTVYVSQKVGI